MHGSKIFVAVDVRAGLRSWQKNDYTDFPSSSWSIVHDFPALSTAVKKPWTTLLPDALYVMCLFLLGKFLASSYSPGFWNIRGMCLQWEPSKYFQIWTLMFFSYREFSSSIWRVMSFPLFLFSLSRTSIIQVLGFLYWSRDSLNFSPLLFQLLFLLNFLSEMSLLYLLMFLISLSWF